MMGMTCCIVYKRISMLLLIISFICPFFFLKETFHHRILSSYYSQSWNFVYILRGAKYIVGKKTKILWLSFAFFFHFSISLSNVILREICVNNFSGTTVPKILKFGTNVGYDLLYCVKENEHAVLIIPLICPFFLSLSKFSVTNFLATMRASLQILYTHWEWQSILRDRKQNSDLFCLIFPFFHLSNVIHREICDKYFSGPIAHRIL